MAAERYHSLASVSMQFIDLLLKRERSSLHAHMYKHATTLWQLQRLPAKWHVHCNVLYSATVAKECMLSARKPVTHITLSAHCNW